MSEDLAELRFLVHHVRAEMRAKLDECTAHHARDTEWVTSIEQQLQAIEREIARLERKS